MMIEAIFDLMHERITDLTHNVKEHDSTNTIGFAYDKGSLDEAKYIKDRLVDIMKKKEEK